jgi:hypothetical protein
MTPAGSEHLFELLPFFGQAALDVVAARTTKALIGRALFAAPRARLA